MRRSFLAAVVTLAACLSLTGTASAALHVRLTGAYYIAFQVVVKKTNADPYKTGDVYYCQRHSRLKVRCPSWTVRYTPGSAAFQVRCEWTTTVFATKSGRVYHAVSPETCGPETPTT
jgi:hypothetical protein